MCKKLILSVSFTLLLGMASSALAVPNVVHEWKFDSDDQDSSPSGNDGTMNGFGADCPYQKLNPSLLN